MISIKLATYSEIEVEKLWDALTTAHTMLKEIHCDSFDCKSCPAHYACYDLDYAIQFLDAEMANSYPHIQKGKK